jgi:hypothetical protein
MPGRGPDAADFVMRPKPVWVWTFAALAVFFVTGAAIYRDVRLLLPALLVGGVALNSGVMRLTLSGTTVRLARPPMKPQVVDLDEGGGISLDISRPIPWFSARIYVLGAKRGRGHEKVLLLSPWFWADWRELIRRWDAHSCRTGTPPIDMIER